MINSVLNFIQGLRDYSGLDRWDILNPMLDLSCKRRLDELWILIRDSIIIRSLGGDVLPSQK